MEAEYCRDQRFNDFNTKYERYRIAHDAINKNVKIAIPRSFNGSTTTLDQTGSTSGPVLKTLNGTHQAANHQVLQIESMNNREDPSHSSEEHGDHHQRWYKNKVIWKRIILCLFLGCLIGACIALILLWDDLNDENRAPYKLEKIDKYKLQMKTKEYGIEFYVKSYDKFNEKYPEGSPARVQIENIIIREYIGKEQRACSWEIWWRSMNDDYATPECDKLQSKGLLLLHG